jgi:hypothetical protein
VKRKSLGPTGQMLKGPVGPRRMEKGPSGDFYDELQASWMSNYRSHKYMSDRQGSHRYTSYGDMMERRLLWRIASVMDE